MQAFIRGSVCASALFSLNNDHTRAIWQKHSSSEKLDDQMKYPTNGQRQDSYQSQELCSIFRYGVSCIGNIPGLLQNMFGAKSLINLI